MERTYRPQTIFQAVTATALAVLITGCGSSTNASTSAMGTISPHPTKPTSSRATSVTSAPGKTTTVLGSVVSRTKVANGYRIVLAPIKFRKDLSWVVLPGRATVTYVIPKSSVPHGFMLSGPMQVTAVGHRVTAFSILG
jgi:hypothetical protein